MNSGNGQLTTERQLARLFLGAARMPLSLHRLEQAVLDRFAHTGDKLDQIRATLSALQSRMEALHQQQDCLEEASRLQRLLSEEHYKAHIVDPLATHLLPLVDLGDDVLAHAYDGSDQPLAEVLRVVKSQVLEALAGYGIEPIAYPPGSTFDPLVMEPHKTLWTSDPERDMTIAESLRLGFRRGKKVLRHQLVAVYRFDRCTHNNRNLRTGEQS
jgi:molecular chaperone GrpE (heat shock protein)